MAVPLPPAPEVDALVVGTPFLDIVLGGLDRWPGPGEELWADRRVVGAGGVANNATVLSRLGRHTALAGAIGTDEIGDLVLELLSREESLSLRHLQRRPELHTPVTVAVGHGGDRSFLSHGDLPALPADAALPVSRCCFLTLGVEPAAWLAAQRQAGSRVFAGLAYQEHQGWDATVLDQLSEVDVLVCNEREAVEYTRCDNVHQALRALVARVPLAVITLGGHGAIALAHDHSTTTAVAPVRVRAVDTTGAGDAFVSALMDAWLRGADLGRAVRHASLISALVVTGLGGSTSAPGPAEVRRLAAAQDGDYAFELDWFAPADLDFPLTSQIGL